jgi:hypothetical protein
VASGDNGFDQQSFDITIVNPFSAYDAMLSFTKQEQSISLVALCVTFNQQHVHTRTYIVKQSIK